MAQELNYTARASFRKGENVIVAMKGTKVMAVGFADGKFDFRDLKTDAQKKAAKDAIKGYQDRNGKPTNEVPTKAAKAKPAAKKAAKKAAAKDKPAAKKAPAKKGGKSKKAPENKRERRAPENKDREVRASA